MRAVREAEGFGRSFIAFAADIKLAHSVFALPFAAAAFVIGKLPIPTPGQALLLLVCMVGARSFAMGMNRFLDHRIDARNPRTRMRKIPSGELTAYQGLAWSLAWAAAFVAAAFALSPLAGYCALPLLFILMNYSLLKRWSWLTHWYLGLCLGLAPVAVAIAITGAVPAPVLLLGLAVTFWTAGFDILYALQDMDFDRGAGLKSVPSAFGPAHSLGLSRVCFAVMVALLAAVGVMTERGLIYFLGVAVVGAILGFEHWLVRDARTTGHSANINAAFFNTNAAVSVIYFLFLELDRLWTIAY